MNPDELTLHAGTVPRVAAHRAPLQGSAPFPHRVRSPAEVRQVDRVVASWRVPGRPERDAQWALPARAWAMLAEGRLRESDQSPVNENPPPLQVKLPPALLAGKSVTVPV